MALAYLTRPSRATDRRRKVSSLAVALVLEVLLILVLLGLGVGTPKGPESRGKGLDISLLPNESAHPTPTAARKQTPRAAAKAARQPPQAIVVPIPKVKLPTPPGDRPLPILILSRADLAAADISKLGTAGKPSSTQGKGDDDRLASGAGDSKVIGTGPNGQPLYNAEWFRKPSDAELAGYLPKSMPDGGGAGLIACRTAPGHRVVDCVELGNSPPGSHLASAVRQAAWQFLVRAPRKGGRELIGEWVRIRIDYQRSRRNIELSPETERNSDNPNEP